MMKKEPKSLRKKLSLHRETVLTLDAYELARAAGGTATTTLPCKQASWCECGTTSDSFC